MSHARKRRRYMRWARYIERNEKHEARRTWGWVKALAAAARVDSRGLVAMPWRADRI